MSSLPFRPTAAPVRANTVPKLAWAPGVQPTAAAPDMMQKLGFYLLMVHLIVLLGRIPEFLHALHLPSLHMAAVAIFFALAAGFLSGGLARALTSTVCQLYIMLTLWFMATVLTSVWRGGSVGILKNYWSVSMITCFLIAGMATTLKQCRAIMYALGGTTLFIVLMTVLLGSSKSQARDIGRFGVVDTSLQNANDLAVVLLLGLPFCLLLSMKKLSWFWKAAALAGSLAIIVTILRTGSRHGLIVLGFLLFFVFLRLSIPQKVMMSMAVVTAIGVGLSVSTQAALDRYRTLFASADDRPVSWSELSAIDSGISRRLLLASSLRLTAEHPVLGVGVGNFAVAISTNNPGDGTPVWRQTHNTYTQISSEAGVPALVLYCAILFLSIRMVNRIRKISRRFPELKDIGNMAWVLELSMFAFVFTAIFGSNGYYYYFPVLAGIAIALDRVSWPLIHASQTAAQARQASAVANPAIPSLAPMGASVRKRVTV